MTPEKIEQLKGVFRMALELEEDADPSDMRKATQPQWDSLAHTTLVAGIESEFGTMLEIADMAAMTSFAATVLLLDEKGV